MSFKALLAGALAMGLASTGTSSAQIESDSMGDLSAWGQRYLSSNEREFPTSLWRNSNDETLLALLQSVRAADLNPAERSLLRRVILSPAARPGGVRAEALLTERARLMLELGEARAAAALMPQLEQAAPGYDAETLAVDLDLASGQEASACGALNGPVKDGDYWLKLRAVCAVLLDNYSGAQLAIEVASAQGVTDDWLVEAIFAASGDTPNPPGARFDSGLNIALSVKAGLDTSDVTIAADRPDLAAAAANRPGVPAELRIRFAELASERDLISPDERRQILLSRFGEEDYEPGSGIEQTLLDLVDPLVPDDEKYERLAATLEQSSRGSLNAYRNTAALFLPDLEALPQAADAAPYALDFANAAMIAGAPETAMSWLTVFDIEGVDPPDLYRVAVLEAVNVIAGNDTSPASLRAIEKRLVGSINTGAQEEKVAAILSAWTGLSIPVSQVGRDFVVQIADNGERMAQGQIIALRAGLLGDAIGESALVVLVTSRGDAKRLAPSDFSVLIAALIALEAEDVARDLAMEITEYWKDPE